MAANVFAKKMDDHGLIPDPVARFKNKAPNVNSKLAARGNKR